MNDLADYKRSKNKRKHVQDVPEGILDVIATDYPSKYFSLLEDRTGVATLFLKEEWIDILTKSRDSYKSHILPMISTRKYSAQ